MVCSGAPPGVGISSGPPHHRPSSESGEPTSRCRCRGCESSRDQHNTCRYWTLSAPEQCIFTVQADCNY